MKLNRKITSICLTSLVAISPVLAIVSCAEKAQLKNYILDRTPFFIDTVKKKNDTYQINIDKIPMIEHTVRKIYYKEFQGTDYKPYTKNIFLHKKDYIKVNYTPIGKYHFKGSNDGKWSKVVSLNIISDKLLKWFKENKIVEKNSGNNLTAQIGDVISAIGKLESPLANISFKEILQPFDLLNQISPNIRPEFSEFIKTIINTENYKEFSNIFNFGEMTVAKFFNAMWSYDVIKEEKTNIAMQWIRSLISTGKLNTLVKLIIKAGKSAGPEFTKIANSLTKIQDANIFALETEDLKLIIKFIRDGILMDPTGAKTFTDAEIDTASVFINKILKGGISQITSTDAEKISKIVFKLTNHKDPELSGYVDVFAKVYTQGVGSLTVGDIKTLAPLFYEKLQTTLKFDKTLVTVDRFAGILYKLLHGFNGTTRTQFEKDFGDLVPALKNLKYSVMNGAININFKTLMDLIFDGKWTITSSGIANLLRGEDDLAKKLSGIIHNGLIGSINSFQALISAIKYTLDGSTISMIQGSIPVISKVKGMINDLNSLGGINKIFESILVNPLKDLSGDTIYNVLKIMQKMGGLKALFKNQKFTDADLKTAGKVVNSIFKNPSALKQSDIKWLIKMVKLYPAFANFDKKISLNGIDGIEILARKLLIGWKKEIKPFTFHITTKAGTTENNRLLEFANLPNIKNAKRKIEVKHHGTTKWIDYLKDEVLSYGDSIRVTYLADDGYKFEHNRTKISHEQKLIDANALTKDAEKTGLKIWYTKDANNKITINVSGGAHISAEIDNNGSLNPNSVIDVKIKPSSGHGWKNSTKSNASTTKVIAINVADMIELANIKTGNETLISLADATKSFLLPMTSQGIINKLKAQTLNQLEFEEVAKLIKTIKVYKDQIKILNNGGLYSNTAKEEFKKAGTLSADGKTLMIKIAPPKSSKAERAWMGNYRVILYNGKLYAVSKYSDYKNIKGAFGIFGSHYDGDTYWIKFNLETERIIILNESKRKMNFLSAKEISRDDKLWEKGVDGSLRKPNPN